jgi:hypothetical protein
MLSIFVDALHVDLQANEARASERVALCDERAFQSDKLDAKLRLDLVILEQQARLCRRAIRAGRRQRRRWVELAEHTDHIKPRLRHATAEVALAIRRPNLRSENVRLRHIGNVDKAD